MKTNSVLVLVAAMIAGYGNSASDRGHSDKDYLATVLVANQVGRAPLTDPNLQNAWGISINPAAGAFWISDNGTGKSSLYTGDVNGSPLAIASLVVGIPDGVPTGTVFNGTPDFVVTSGGASAPALFLFASESGDITGWNPTVPAPVATVAQIGVTVPGAVFKGLAIGSFGGANFLYATDFAGGKVRMFNRTFSEIASPGGFVDPRLPSDYAPFGIANIDGTIFVTYAQKEDGGDDDVSGRGHGFVDAFDTQGHLLARIASRKELNSPWGMAKAPMSFGRFGGALLVGNFGDGRINAFDPIRKKFLGSLHGKRGGDLRIPGLWGLAFGNGVSAGDSNTLYFTGGPNGEADGVFGKITVAH